MHGAAGDAKRLCVSHMYDILIINTPLADDFGVRTAIDLSEQHHNMGILLLVKMKCTSRLSVRWKIMEL